MKLYVVSSTIYGRNEVDDTKGLIRIHSLKGEYRRRYISEFTPSEIIALFPQPSKEDSTIVVYKKKVDAEKVASDSMRPLLDYTQPNFLIFTVLLAPHLDKAFEMKETVILLNQKEWDYQAGEFIPKTVNGFTVNPNHLQLLSAEDATNDSLPVHTFLPDNKRHYQTRWSTFQDQKEISPYSLTGIQIRFYNLFQSYNSSNWCAHSSSAKNLKTAVNQAKDVWTIYGLFASAKEKCKEEKVNENKSSYYAMVDVASNNTAFAVLCELIKNFQFLCEKADNHVVWAIIATYLGSETLFNPKTLESFVETPLATLKI